MGNEIEELLEASRKLIVDVNERNIAEQNTIERYVKKIFEIKTELRKRGIEYGI